MDLCADTKIGRGIDGQRALWAMLLATVIVVMDITLVLSHIYVAPFRLLVLGICVAVYGKMVGWHMDSLGLVLLPAQLIRYWLGVIVLLGGIMATWLAIACGILWLVGHPMSIHPLPLRLIPHAYYYACISAPVFEEIVYRLALCVAVTALLGPKWAIVISGIVFAACHILGGVGAPDNLVAGFILGWAFLKSGSLTVPIVLHALGNFCVVTAESVMGILTYGIPGHS